MEKYKFDSRRKNRPIDIINTAYLIYIAVFYPVIMSDMYFNITITRTRAFVFGTLVFMILAALAWVMELIMISYYDDKYTFSLYRDRHPVAMPDLWMLLFMLANVMAWIMADSKYSAFTGSSGRYFGLGMVMVIAIMFIILSRQVYVGMTVYYCFLAVACFAYVLSVLQHVGLDPFSLRERVKENQKEMFISLFGNLNIYGSFVALSLALFMAVFIFSKKRPSKIFSALALCMGGMSVITAKSDNVYIGLFAAGVLLFFMAFLSRKTEMFFASITVIISGLFIMSLLNEKYHEKDRHLNGLAELLVNKQVMGVILAASLLITGAILLIKYRKREWFDRVHQKKTLLIITAVAVAALAAAVIKGVKSGSELFTFNDDWGTYRGFVWTRTWYMFCDAPVLNKLFGFGNETYASLINASYYQEMLEVTDMTYDNAHNEVIQYLITTGLFGAVSYMGLFVSGVIYMIKRAKEDPVAIACAASCVAYFAQGLVDVNQPITTPFYFVIMAAGIGFIRYRDRRYGVYRETAK